MRLMVISADPAVQSRLRSSVEVRWLRLRGRRHTTPCNAARWRRTSSRRDSMRWSSIMPGAMRRRASRSIARTEAPDGAARLRAGDISGRAIGDALCEAALNAGACAAVAAVRTPPRRCLRRSVAPPRCRPLPASSAITRASFAQEQRFNGARIPGYRRMRTLAIGHFAELHVAESDAARRTRGHQSGPRCHVRLGAGSCLPPAAAGARHGAARGSRVRREGLRPGDQR